MTAATLHQVCGGRYVLGLGASTKALAEGFHDTAFEHPAAKLRDAVTKVRALLAGQPAQLGQVPAARPLRLGQPPAPHARPLTVAAGPVTVADENAAAARDIAAACIAWYLGAMGEVYARSMSGQGYAAEVQAIIAANPRPNPRRGTIPPSAEVILDQLAAYGTCDQVREQLQPWDRAADIVTILLPPGMPWPTIEATLLAAAPSTRPVRPRSLSAPAAGQATPKVAADHL